MRLTKHHGLGNDFLVLADPAGTRQITAELARAVCDRRRGVGADGLLRLSPGSHGAQVTMELRNADGSRAEMSGNGIGCLVQAALICGMAVGPRVTVDTDAGPRTVDASPGGGPRSHMMTVDMGAATVGADEPEWVQGDVLRAARVDIGNPHLVMHVGSFDGIALDELGAEVNRVVPGGTNVELIRPGANDGEIDMVVYERGVGLTEACGTGACASAAAAVAWDLAPSDVVVHQPGGMVAVQARESVHMTVPVVQVATVEWL